MLNLLLILVPLTSLSAFGFHYACRFHGWMDFDKLSYEQTRSWNLEQRELLWWVRYYGALLPWYLQKPLYKCPMCMSSVHSLLTLTTAWYFTGMQVDVFLLLPVLILASCGLTAYVQYNFNTW